MDNRNTTNNSNNKDLDLDKMISYYSKKDNDVDKKQVFPVKSAEPLRNNMNQNTPVNRNPMQGNIPDNNTNQKKKFVVHISDDELNYSAPAGTEKPADNSSVYFSNYKGRNVNVVKPNQMQQNRASMPKASNMTTANVNNSNKSNTKNKSKKNKRSIGGKFAIVLFAVILIFTSLASYISITTINDILAVTTSDDAVEVRVFKQGSGGEENPDATLNYEEIINILADNDLISQRGLCKIFAKFRHFDNSDYQFKPGIYTFKKSMGVEGMLYKCLRQNRTTETITISFPEGWTITQMFEKLEKNKVCTAKSLYAVLDSYLEMHAEDYPFIKSVPESNNRYQLFEGYLFPDTYDFYVESDPNFVIDKLFNSFNTQWTDEYQKQADKLGYSMDEIVIIASIIQKEAADSSQMKDVSSVIHNRLKNSTNYPSIGCDSTYNYISNYFDSTNFAISQKNFYLNKYATDTNRGLPPGPICNPGLDAIEAALYPKDTSYYFFQHDKHGKIYLATTKNQFDYDYSVVQRINNEE